MRGLSRATTLYAQEAEAYIPRAEELAVSSEKNMSLDEIVEREVEVALPCVYNSPESHCAVWQTESPCWACRVRPQVRAACRAVARAVLGECDRIVHPMRGGRDRGGEVMRTVENVLPRRLYQATVDCIAARGSTTRIKFLFGAEGILNGDADKAARRIADEHAPHGTVEFEVREIATVKLPMMLVASRWTDEKPRRKAKR